MKAIEFIVSKKNVHPTDPRNLPPYVVGPEIEHTAAYSKKTLIVNKPASIEEIEQALTEFDCEALYLELSRATGHTYGKTTNNQRLIDTYHKQAEYFLKKGYWVTIDSPNNFAENFSDLTNNKKFVINMAVMVPGVEKLKGNVSLKLMGGDYKNPADGVWCFDLDKIKQDKNLTKWHEYKIDKRVDIKK